MKKKLFSVIMVVSMLLSMIPLTTHALVVGDWEIEISNGEAAIIGYTGKSDSKFVLPDTIGNYPVVGIKGYIFADNVVEIVVPEGYRYLKEKDGLTRYTDKDRVLGNIKDSLKNITLPQSLEELEISFEGCVALKQIEIPAKVKIIKMIECDYGLYGKSGQFENCSNLEIVKLNAGLKIIEGYAFANCEKLKDFIIPDTVKEIQLGVFQNCDSLVNMIIPDGVVNFGPSTTLNYGAAVDAVFSNCDNLETVVIGDGVQCLYHRETVGGRCYTELSNCPKLKSVYLGKSIKTISGADSYLSLDSQKYYRWCGALGNSISLKTVIIPEGVEQIGQLFLTGSDNMENLVVPKSVTYLGSLTHKTYSNFVCKNYDGKPLPKMFVYGYKGTAAEEYFNSQGFPFVDISVATPTDSSVKINSKKVAFTAYNIGGNNYFKLRDVAAAINSTGKNFNVGWDGNNNAILLTSNSSYNSVGGELDINSGASAVEPQIANSKIFVDGKLITFMAFNIGGNNYFKLRDIGEVFDFDVEWNASDDTIEINTSAGYSG